MLPGRMSTRIGLRVRGLRAVEHLHERRDRLIRGVAGEAVDRQPRGMAEEAAQGDLLLLGELVLRHLPGDELGIHVLIQGELALFHQSQRPQGRHGLADRTGLEERGGRHRGIPALLRHAIAFRLDDLAVLDDGEGEAGNLSLPHLGPDHVVDGVGRGIGRRRSRGRDDSWSQAADAPQARKKRIALVMDFIATHRPFRTEEEDFSDWPPAPHVEARISPPWTASTAAIIIGSRSGRDLVVAETSRGLTRAPRK